MSRTRHRSSTVAAIAAAAMMFGCAAEDGDGNDDNGAVDDGQSENGESDGDGASASDPGEDVLGDGFDRDEAEQRAEELIGTPEDDVAENDATRIVARGDESFASTDDLVPGRANVTLDEVDGEWIVTHVMIETDGDAPPIEVDIANGDQNGATDDNGAADGDGPAASDPGEGVLGDGFDPDEAQARADALIGLHEDDIVENEATRITIRGDEDFEVHADLVPGRADLTVDEVDGEWIVTSVRIAAGSGEAEIHAHLGTE